MLYVKLNKDQATKVKSKDIGYTSGKRCKSTGIRESIMFCSNLVFLHTFGAYAEKEFIEI